MEYYKLVHLALTIFTYLFVLSGVFLLYTIYKDYRYTDILSKKVYSLGKEVTAEKVEDFRIYLDVKHIPFRFYTFNLIKAGYSLVNMNEGINIELKERLKISVSSKGVLVD